MNSQDRALLELAAKAAGVAGVFVEAHGPDIGQDAAGIGRPGALYGDRLWNPLDDDGDAFRLAFALKVPIWYWRNGTIESMRRAIVSIAAKWPF